MSLDSLAHIKTRSPLKVSIVFAVGILLPCAFLTFLGLRSYRYEGRLMQKETEERYTAVADLVENKVTTQISDWIRALRTVASQPSFQRLDVAEILPLLLARPKVDNLTPSALYVFDDGDQMVVPWRAESQASGFSTTRRELDWGPYADEIERLERLEFAQKDYPSAIDGYIALESKVSSPALQAALLKNIGSNYRKLHHYGQAAAAYQKLAQNYDAVWDFSGYPMGLLGRQMALDLYEQDGAWDKALEIRLELLEGLLIRRWKIPEIQQKTLLRDVRTAMDAGLTKHGNTITTQKQRLDRLRTLQDSYDALARSGEHFAKEEWPSLLQRSRRQARADQGGFFILGTPRATQIALIAPILQPGTDHRRGRLVALFPAESVWSKIQESVQPLIKPSGLQIEWDQALSGLKTPRHFWKAKVQREVQTIDPPLRFALMDGGSSARDQLYRRRQWIFGGMVGLSFLVILVGLVIMAQAVKRETEVANLKADFVANVSHELRTPLAAISHIGERLSLGRYRSDEERKEFYQLLGQETGRLKGLIEDILDFSKVLAGKKTYKTEPLDLGHLAQEALDYFEHKADAQGFKITTHLPDTPLPILGDPRALIQVVMNLLDNAMKYSGKSREIELRVERTAENGIVAVKDHGIGIPDSEKPKIFEKFYRVERATPIPGEGGVGLGLAMVKHVVEGHNGKIQVDSQVNKGTTFSLIFPLAKGGQHGAHPSR